MTRISDPAGLSNPTTSLRGLAIFQVRSLRGTQRAAVVSRNYHSNLPALSGLPTIKHYELPSALILPG